VSKPRGLARYGARELARRKRALDRQRVVPRCHFCDGAQLADEPVPVAKGQLLFKAHVELRHPERLVTKPKDRGQQKLDELLSVMAQGEVHKPSDLARLTETSIHTVTYRLRKLLDEKRVERGETRGTYVVSDGDRARVSASPPRRNI
jgi:hypothetical protein